MAREEEAPGRLAAAHPRGARPRRVAVGLEEVPCGPAPPARLMDRPRGEVGPVGAYGGGAHPGVAAEGPRHVDGRQGRELLAPGLPEPPGLRLSSAARLAALASLSPSTRAQASESP